jgi:hypothetical protein
VSAVSAVTTVFSSPPLCPCLVAAGLGWSPACVLGVPRHLVRELRSSRVGVTDLQHRGPVPKQLVSSCSDRTVSMGSANGCILSSACWCSWRSTPITAPVFHPLLPMTDLDPFMSRHVMSAGGLVSWPSVRGGTTTTTPLSSQPVMAWSGGRWI